MNNKQNALLSIGLFSGLGIFSFLLLINYSDLPPKVADALAAAEGILDGMVK